VELRFTLSWITLVLLPCSRRVLTCLLPLAFLFCCGPTPPRLASGLREGPWKDIPPRLPPPLFPLPPPPLRRRAEGPFPPRSVKRSPRGVISSLSPCGASHSSLRRFPLIFLGGHPKCPPPPRFFGGHFSLVPSVEISDRYSFPTRLCVLLSPFVLRFP
jgi:hypothetical protein